MRSFLGSMACILCLGLAAVQADEFQAANAQYDAGQFAAAAAAYEAIPSRTAAVYFNLGNAYFRQDKLGLAALNYQRARHLAPRDPDILANLRLVETRLGVAELNEPPSVLARLWRAGAERWTVAEWRWAQVLALWFSAAMLAGWFWWPRARVGWMSALAAGILGLGLAVANLAWLTQRPPVAVAVTASEARFAPLASATVHYAVPPGLQLDVIEDRGGWWFVQRTDGRRGWVPATAVQRIAPD